MNLELHPNLFRMKFLWWNPFQNHDPTHLPRNILDFEFLDLESLKILAEFLDYNKGRGQRSQALYIEFEYDHTTYMG